MANHVLIVDDQKDISRLLRSALETIEQGLSVSEAPSGEEAILVASRTKVDLLITDFRLPGITGVELMKKIRVRNPDVKIIIVSGVSDSKMLKEVEESGADAFFPKPISIADFLDGVERCLGMARTIVHPSDVKKKTGPLPQEEEHKGISDLLVNLRKDLNAQSVMLLNGLGHVEAEAGQLPDPTVAVSLVSSLMTMYNAAQKVASLLDHTENHLHLFDSNNTDGIFLPIGPAHALLLIGKGLADAKTLATKLDLLFTARIEILHALQSIGVEVAAPQEPTPEPAKPQQRSAIDEPFTRPEDLPSEFMDIFSQIGKKTVDANAFWDTAVEQGTTFTEPDKLTYEQASRLGLAPDSDSATDK
jgi:two-component system response regulator (stage 0 sporulation protein F)